MQDKLKAKVTRLRIAAIALALSGGGMLVAAIADHTPRRIGLAVLWLSLSIVFFSNARRTQKALQSEQVGTSNESQ